MSLFLSVGAMAQTTQKVEINLTTTTGQPGYVSSPHDHAVINPYSQSDKGGVAALIDGDPNTHFHTAWENVPAGPHYFQVDLGEENTIGDFSFNYVSRKEARSDFPSQFTIKGSTNGNDFELIKVINIDMPSTPEAAAGESYSFDVTGVTKEYRYLRFEVTNTKSYDNVGYRTYFHAAEFDLFKIVTEETGRADYVHNTGYINRDDRGLRSFKITDGENSLEVNDIQTSGTAPVYVDKSAQKFTTTAGSTLEFSEFNWDGWAMHAFAFIDYNKDYTFNSTANNNGEGNGEVVSYNHYDGYDITGEDNSNGNTQNQLTYGTSKGMPAFKLPADLAPGEYRMRIKIDWNNLDADYGASDIAANGGCQCDITLVVEESAANKAAKAELKAAIEELDAFLASISVGNCITQYSSSIDSPEAQIEGIRNFYNEINDETTIESIEEKTANVRAIKESYKENVLEDGKFYHIRSVVYENGYVYASLSDNIPNDDREERNGILWKATTAPSNTAIWKCEIINDVIYFKNIYTASYMNGLRSQSPGALSETEKAPITLTALGDGQVNFLVNGEPAHAQNSTDGYHNFVPWPGEKGSPSAWYVEEATAGVQPHVLTVGAAGYATLMLGYNTTIPTIDGNDCGVFTATIEGKYAVLNEINGVLPANTAVIVKAAKGEYAFAYTTETATVENNVLRGTLYDKYITEDAYVLGIKDSKVGFYTATTTGQAEGTFLNNANKAYLPKTAGMNAASYSFRFGKGTTGVEEVKVENGEVKAIYDLTGRKVAEPTKGIYIIGGKKVLVK